MWNWLSQSSSWRLSLLWCHLSYSPSSNESMMELGQQSHVTHRNVIQQHHTIIVPALTMQIMLCNIGYVYGKVRLIHGIIHNARLQCIRSFLHEHSISLHHSKWSYCHSTTHERSLYKWYRFASLTTVFSSSSKILAWIIKNDFKQVCN